MAPTVDTAGTLHVRCLDGASGLADLKGVWNRLADGNALGRWEWSGLWWQHFNPGRQLFTLVVHDDSGDVLGIVPLMIERRLFGGREFVTLGSGEASFDHQCVLTVPGWEQPVAQAAARWLARQGRARWNAMRLPRFETRLTANFHFLQTLEAHGMVDLRSSCDVNWRVALSPDWKSHFAWLVPSQQKRIREVETRLLATGRATLHDVGNDADLEQGLAALSHLQPPLRTSFRPLGRRWSVRFQSFVHDVARQLHEQQRLRLVWVRSEGRPVAAWLGVRGGDTMFTYALAAADGDARWHTLLMADVTRRAIDEQFDYLDLGDAEPATATYWRAEPRPVCDVRIVTPQAGLRSLLWDIAAKASDWASSWRTSDRDERVSPSTWSS